MFHETTRQCGGAGSSSSSRCRAFPGTEASAGNCCAFRRQSNQREALEADVESGGSGRFGRHAASRPRAQALRETKRIVNRSPSPRAAGCRISHRLVDLPRVSAVVHKQFGVSYHPAHMGRVLHDLGFSPQKPRRVAREQDPDAVERWRTEDWSRIKKKLAGAAPVLFLSMKRDFNFSP